MRRGVVLPFPSPRGLRDDDRASLQRFVAAVPGAHAEILVGRNRREVVILTLAGRHVWITRDKGSVSARDATSGHHLARGTCLGDLLATMQAALLPGAHIACSGAAEVPHGAPHDPHRADHQRDGA